jgi:N-acetylglutamate synthase-like GNAT family acetyltransferase
VSVATIIRRADEGDAEGISRTILRAIQITNAVDYPPHVIAAVIGHFTPQHVLAHLANRQVFVAVIDGKIVGTASLHGRVVRSVYVDPDNQGTGIGVKLMEAVEELARHQGLDGVSVPSSITEEFYRRRGFVFVRNEHHGDERTIIMEKKLSA